MLKLGKYRHYKGKEYEVIGLAHLSETFEPMVVYRALYNSPDFGDQALWVRSLSVFQEMVIVEGKEVSRFAYIGLKEEQTP